MASTCSRSGKTPSVAATIGSAGRPAGPRGPAEHELFVSDGYTNKRVIVFDRGTASIGVTGAPTATVLRTGHRTLRSEGAAGQQFADPFTASRFRVMAWCTWRTAPVPVEVFRRMRQVRAGRLCRTETRGFGSAQRRGALGGSEQRLGSTSTTGPSNCIWICRRETLEVVAGSFGPDGARVDSLFGADGQFDNRGNVNVGEICAASPALQDRRSRRTRFRCWRCVLLARATRELLPDGKDLLPNVVVLGDGRHDREQHDPARAGDVPALWRGPLAAVPGSVVSRRCVS